MDETFNMGSTQDPAGPEQSKGGILRRLRDREQLRKRKAEAEERETNQVESKRRRARGEQRSSNGKRGRPRKADNLPEVLPIQEEEKVEESVPQVAQPPAEDSLPDVVKVDPAQTLYSRLPPPVYVPTAPLLDVASVEAPIVASSATRLFPPAPALAPAPAPAPSPAPNVVPEPTVPTPKTAPPSPTSTFLACSSSSLPAPSGQSQTDPIPSLEAPVSARPPLAPASSSSSALVYATKEGEVTIEDLGPDELEDVRLVQQEVTVQDLDTDSVEGPSPPEEEPSNVCSIPLLASIQEY